MFPSRAALSKASRLPMTPKMGNKDYYKGTRAAYLPGGHRTGAPGKHIIRGTGKYRLVDSQVRFFVAPPIEEINNSALKPYVHTGTRLSFKEGKQLYGRLPQGGFDGEHYLKLVNPATKPFTE